ncbi:MAG: hypothetical protein LBK96_03925 [Prevotellaceae bacterium]|jgi:hypothetical protein|nr:hypothetical protein [Prevotellaceae bacterium]
MLKALTDRINFLRRSAKALADLNKVLTAPSKALTAYNNFFMPNLSIKNKLCTFAALKTIEN